MVDPNIRFLPNPCQSQSVLTAKRTVFEKKRDKVK